MIESYLEGLKTSMGVLGVLTPVIVVLLFCGIMAYYKSK